jgi:hypothetical protein
MFGNTGGQLRSGAVRLVELRTRMSETSRKERGDCLKTWGQADEVTVCLRHLIISHFGRRKNTSRRPRCDRARKVY